MIKEKARQSVPLPEGITAEIAGSKITLKGSGKEASREIKANGIKISQEGQEIVVSGKPATRKMNALVKTIVSHIKNMASGLQTEYIYTMAVVYSHFPMNVAVKGSVFEINNFVGEKKMRTAKILEGVTVTAKGKEITVKSHSKEAAGQTAANIENATKVKGKDKRIYQDGIFITQKAVQEKKEEGK